MAVRRLHTAVYGSRLAAWYGHGSMDVDTCLANEQHHEALAGKKVIGLAAGHLHTAVWTEAGELFTFGDGDHGQLGHGGTQHELVPRLVGALAGKKVIGPSAGSRLFGNGIFGHLRGDRCHCPHGSASVGSQRLRCNRCGQEAQPPGLLYAPPAAPSLARRPRARLQDHAHAALYPSAGHSGAGAMLLP